MTRPDDPVAPPTLDYAEGTPRAARIDLTVLIAGIVQGGLSGYLAFNFFSELGRGNTEFRDATALQRIAYVVLDSAGVLFMSTIVAALSAVAIMGSLLPPGRRRHVCYAVYLAGILALIAAVVAALFILHDADFSSRWVYMGGGTPKPYEWRYFTFETTWYWQLPLLLLIGNPVLIALAVRGARQLTSRSRRSSTAT